MPAKGSKTLPALPAELSARALSRPCNPKSLGFSNTAELPDLLDVIGQPRAFRALQLGSELSSPGYNTFVLGLPGSGRTTLSKEYLERKAEGEPRPDDWCYVNNFENLTQPKALRLPAGQAIVFRKAILELIQYCEREIPRVFESEEYTHERDRLVAEVKKNQETEFIALQKRVEQFNFIIVRTTSGIMLAPAVDGKPIKAEDVQNLSPEQRQKLSELEARLTQDIEKTMLRLREMEKSATEQLFALNTRTMQYLLTPMMNNLREQFGQREGVAQYLDALQSDLISHAPQFLPGKSSEEESRSPLPDNKSWLRRYEVNVLVNNDDLQGAPVVTENYPSYNNLIGRIEHEMILGASRTDFTMIRPGALHRANGGYLVLPARDVLINPYAWEGLKRVLRDGEVRIVELANQIGLLSTTTLEPEPIPLAIKVILVGTPMLYYMLRAYDEDFSKLFKVRAEFATTMERNPENEHEYGLFINSVVIENQLLPFDRTAVARVVEFGAREADDQNRLSTRFGKIADLVREASYWASRGKQKKVNAKSVQRAIDEMVYRSNLVEERLQEFITQGTIMIDVTGTATGQINALSVYMLGDYEFGRPNRVTATAFPGKGGVVDIERQAKLGGSLHTKGVLILSGYLNGHYGFSLPLNLSANLTFEQSYDEVQGDSASAAELLALLSAIANIPLRQDRAITGSVNQHGEVQAIGGVNEKIEGFYAVCNAKGLSGEQGVIIPKSNIRHLMLKDEVIQAVKDGKFHIWAVSHVEEAISLLSDRPAGERQEDGSYPARSFNQAVMERLKSFNKAMLPQSRDNAKKAEAEGKENEANEQENLEEKA
ncbi:MAG: AAA family ATPase [Anaerolineales bacterium]|nr:AAA family ATPase [Anaerolineales bacterium]